MPAAALLNGRAALDYFTLHDLTTVYHHCGSSRDHVSGNVEQSKAAQPLSLADWRHSSSLRADNSLISQLWPILVMDLTDWWFRWVSGSCCSTYHYDSLKVSCKIMVTYSDVKRAPLFCKKLCWQSSTWMTASINSGLVMPFSNTDLDQHGFI